MSTRKYSECRPGNSRSRRPALRNDVLYVDTKILSISVRTSTSKISMSTRNNYPHRHRITNIDSKTISYVDPENPWQSTPMQTPTYKTTSSLTHKIFGVDTRRVVVPLNQHLLTYNASHPTHTRTLAATSHENSLSLSSNAISW